MAKIFVTADPHLDHPGILKHCATTRPYQTLDGMNEDIVSKWNDDVGKHDQVIIIGDFAWKRPEY